MQVFIMWLTQNKHLARVSTNRIRRDYDNSCNLRNHAFKPFKYSSDFWNLQLRIRVNLSIAIKSVSAKKLTLQMLCLFLRSLICICAVAYRRGYSLFLLVFGNLAYNNEKSLGTFKIICWSQKGLSIPKVLLESFDGVLLLSKREETVLELLMFLVFSKLTKSPTSDWQEFCVLRVSIYWFLFH